MSGIILVYQCTTRVLSVTRVHVSTGVVIVAFIRRTAVKGIAKMPRILSVVISETPEALLYRCMKSSNLHMQMKYIFCTLKPVLCKIKESTRHICEVPVVVLELRGILYTSQFFIYHGGRVLIREVHRKWIVSYLYIYIYIYH